MSQLSQTVRFATGLYRQRLDIAYAAHVHHAPLAQLDTRAGHSDPYAVYRRMRADGPLAPTRKGNWVTVSHRICSAVLRDRRFGVVRDPYLDMSFLGMNPPDHTRLRRLAQPAFSPKTLPAYQTRIERTVEGLLDRAASAPGTFDLVSGFAAPLPITVITDLLGIPDADSGQFAAYGAAVGSALDGIRSLRQARRVQAAAEKLGVVFDRLIDLRRREPGDDLTSRLVAAEGGQVHADELRPLINLLLIAGFETTVNLIGSCVLNLLRHPDQWQALCAEPERLAPQAVEETLRYDPPVQATSRIALEDLELEGTPVHLGQSVVTMIGAAGRDPEVYERPEVFDIERVPEVDHLAFSGGIHYCVGQPLARMEAVIALRLLATRMPSLRVAGRPRLRPATAIRGPLYLPVRVAPAQATLTA
ncbi:cytochrome P450 [Actinospica robiniae]|uniref:cytochrome P450 n=1 Tax=Actinospica robiniae TaxID=304901 RepID=UPI0003F871A2|nr:cytochrome P450 [Actinospica robiniae]